MYRGIINRCGELFDVHPRDLIGQYRFNFIAEARFALYMSFHLRGWTNAKIGRVVSRDRSTVFYGLNRARYLMERRPAYTEKVYELAAIPIIPFYMRGQSSETTLQCDASEAETADCA